MEYDYKSSFQVRSATYDDIKDIMDITKEAFTKYREATKADYMDALHETYDDVKHDIDTKVVLIALSDGEPVGSVRVEIRDDNTAYLTRFAVKISNQNTGIGKSIMHLVDNIMEHNHVKRMYLHTASRVCPLIRFYYGRGFYTVSTDNERGYIRALMAKDYS